MGVLIKLQNAQCPQLNAQHNFQLHIDNFPK